MYAGVLSLGVGDSIAAVSGTLIGRHKWPGSNKTFEGSFMSVVCQMIVIVMIVICDNSLPLLSKKVWGVLMGSVISGAIMEAYTHQIDNLILGPFQFAICIALL
jgi:dolichol kinase